MGADQHIDDPDDRADLVVRAYELYAESRSLSRVREEMADDPVTLRVCGARRLFSRDTISTWITEGRAAEAAVYLYHLAEQRADSDTRLSLLAAVAWEHLKVRNGGTLDTGDLLDLLEFMRKIERDRVELLGLKVPVTNKVEINGGTAEIPENIRAMVAAARRRAIEQGRALVDDAYPGATVVPTPPRSRRNRRTS